MLIAVEERGLHLGRIRIRQVADATTLSLLEAVQARVERGSAVRMDGCCSYIPLPPAGYRPVEVRRTAEVGKNLLPLVNRVAILLKSWLQRVPNKEQYGLPTWTTIWTNLRFDLSDRHRARAGKFSFVWFHRPWCLSQ